MPLTVVFKAQFWRRNAIVAFLYFVGGCLGLTFAIPPGHASAVWPPSGIALAAVLFWGPTVAPGIAVGAMTANLWATLASFPGASPLRLCIVAGGIAGGSMAQALVMRHLLRRLSRGAECLMSGLDALRFVLVAGPLGCILAATCGLAVLWTVGMVPDAGLGVGWLTWWLGDMVGVLLVTPIVLLWGQDLPRWDFRQFPEVLIVSGVLACVGWLVFGTGLAPTGLRLPIVHLLLPPLIWAVMRFGLFGAVASNLAVALMATWATAAGIGPFSGYGVEAGLMLLDAYLISFMAVSVVLGASVDESVRARRAVTQAHAELQERFDQRSSAVVAATAALGHERDFTGLIMDTVEALVIVLDPEARIVRFNRACEALTGYRFEDVRGRSFVALLIPAEQRAPLQASFARLSRQGTTGTYENEWLTRDGERRTIIWSNAVLCNAEGEVSHLIGTGLDITVVRQTEQALRLSETRLARHVAQTPVGVIEWDLDRRVREWNPAAAALFGCDWTSARDLRARDLVAEADGLAFLAAWTALIGGAGGAHLVVECLRANGDVFVGEWHNTALTDEHGRVVAVASMVEDITQRRRFEQGRDKLVHDLQEAVRLRQEFISIASHELQTPITSLQLAVQRLLSPSGQESLTPDRRQRHLETIKRQTRRLSALVDSLLDVTRIQAGQFVLAPEACDLVVIVQDVLARLDGDAGQAGSSISVTGPAAIPGHWDRLRMDQVLTNLLSNAIKYGRGQPIAISLNLKGTVCEVACHDGGIGIPAGDLLRIFAPFERAQETTQYSGLGLGLYIAQCIVSAHGGEIWAESVPAVGTTVHLSLPTSLMADIVPAARDVLGG
ncbi:MAG: MASE1 domain-containing protein [Candidatus Sericytochromatia bacterium]|nr:MASE1 domain-containing protein [Candidatus Sericytochromatia bacterium]